MITISHLLQLGALATATLCAAHTSDVPTPQDLAMLASGWEVTQHASDLSFYKAPANFSPDLAPGTLLKIEVATNLTNYTVPSSLSMSRILYVTEDANGRILPTSAYILWPYNTLPRNDTAGYPIAAWAHGTSGLFQPCGPSNYRSLQYHFMIPYELAFQGTVVVAADYAGLGVGSLPNGEPIRSQWATTPSNSNDVAYAIVAARSAFPEYLRKDGPFVTLGHSQGGRTAWGFAERQAQEPIAGYRGTVAFAPAGDAVAQVEQALEDPAAYWSCSTQELQPMIADAVAATYPSYNRSSALSEQLAEIWDTAYEPSQGCLPTQTLLFSTLPITNLSRPGWTKDREVKQWQKLTAVGRKEFTGPLLVIQGTVDAIIPFNQTISSSTQSTVEGTCDAMKHGNWTASLELVGYENMDHFPVIQASRSRWSAWVQDRLSLTAPPPSVGCSISVESGFRTDHTIQSPAPNYLVEWRNKTESWEYVL